jgi:uncharacterized membrane protein SirB2
LIVYVLLGLMALRFASTPSGRLGAFVAALCVYGTIISVARSHHPLGIFRVFLE